MSSKRPSQTLFARVLRICAKAFLLSVPIFVSLAMTPPSTTMDRRKHLVSAAEIQALYRDGAPFGLREKDLLMVIDTAKQKASLCFRKGAIATFMISTSAYGIGNQAGSNKTPLGWHVVKERYGDNAAPGSVFVSRRFQGRVIPESQWRSPTPAEDLVLTRILWLAGLEKGVNSGRNIDSHERCIYLHGTNQEQLLGSVASHGCIRFSNSDIITVFNLTDGYSLYCLIR